MGKAVERRIETRVEGIYGGWKLGRLEGRKENESRSRGGRKGRWENGKWKIRMKDDMGWRIGDGRREKTRIENWLEG